MLTLDLSSIISDKKGPVRHVCELGLIHKLGALIGESIFFLIGSDLEADAVQCSRGNSDGDNGDTGYEVQDIQNQQICNPSHYFHEFVINRKYAIHLQIAHCTSDI